MGVLSMSILKNIILEVGDGGPGTTPIDGGFTYNEFGLNTVSYGGPNDALGAAFTGAQIKSEDLRLKFQVNAAEFNPGDIVNVDFVRLTVWYDMPAVATGPCKIFDTANNGRSVADAKKRLSIFNAKKRHE